MTIDDCTRDRVLGTKAQHPEWSSSTIAIQLGLTKDSVQKIIRRSAAPDFIPVDTPPVVIAPLTRSGNRIVIGDAHVPSTDPAMIDRLIDAANEYDAHELDIVGDLFNLDIFSVHPHIGKVDSYDKELRVAAELLAHLRKHFTHVRWCRGNHDQRLSVLTQGQISMQHLAAQILPDASCNKMPDNFEISSYNYMHASCSGVDWLLTHQFEYSRSRLKVAGDLAVMWQCNVISHHEHHAGMSISPDGRWTTVNNPALSDSFDYVRLNITSRPRMCKGFTVLADGRVDQYVQGAHYGLGD